MPNSVFDPSDFDVQQPTGGGILAKIWEDESLKDFSFECSDGKLVPATRCVLAARSDVFHKMLVGDFAESNQKVVKVGFDSAIMESIVEHVCKGTGPILNAQVTTDLSDDQIDAVEDLVSLVGAAVYYNLSDLCEDSFNALETIFKSFPQLAFVALESFRQGGLESPSVERLILSYVASRKITEISQLTVARLSKCALEEILSHPGLQMLESHAFDLLLAWTKAGGEEQTEERRGIALSLVDHIQLDLIDMEILTTTVKNSGLVSLAKLIDAYEKEYFELKTRGAALKKFHRIPPGFWKSTNDRELKAAGGLPVEDVLKVPAMVAGLHEWVVEVVEDSYSLSTRLGIVLTKQKYRSPGRLLGDSSTGACIVENDAFSNPSGRCFSKGSLLTFTLDLRPGNKGNGTLAMAVDGGQSVLVGSNLREYLDEEKGVGFVPYALLKRDARIRIVEINMEN